jgi:hypothetical protein
MIAFDTQDRFGTDMVIDVQCLSPSRVRIRNPDPDSQSGSVYGFAIRIRIRIHNLDPDTGGQNIY